MKKIILSACVIFGITLTATAQKRYIGEKYGGGVIFWLEADGFSGLIVAEEDLQGIMNWDQAIDMCKKLKLNGFENWHLPTKDELNQLYVQKTAVGGLKSDHYWSSKDYAISNNAVVQFFGDGGLRDEDKSNHYRVRVVRSFSLSLSDLMAKGIIPETKINDQIWMTINLDVSTYRNGDVIQEVADPAAWLHLKTGAWCNYENKSENGTTYGKLYNWYAVNDPRGLAPAGWHIPTDAEWSTLETTLGGAYMAGGKMKSTGTKTWNGLYNTGVSNTNSFAGLPGGYRTNFGSFYDVFELGFWWSSTENFTSYAWSRNLFYGDGYIDRGYNIKQYGFSVRCVKD